MSRLSDISPAVARGISWNTKRERLAVWALVLGVLGTCALLALGASPGAVPLPLSFGILAALCVCPFPAADRWLAVGLLGTLPLLPPMGLPNLPLAAAVLPIALGRVALDGGIRIDARVVIALGLLWGSIALGAALSHWPAVSIWLRPTALLCLAALASVLGAMVWSDQDRRNRWLDGLSLALLVVATTAVLVFALQYFIPIRSIVDGLTTSLEFLRGEGAAAKFEDQNNWVIWGKVLMLRAFSPFFPAPTNTGGLIGLLAPIVAAHWLVHPGGAWRRIAAMAIVVSAAVVLVSFSRSTWLSAGVGVLAVAGITLLYQGLRRASFGRYGRPLGTLIGITALGLVVGVAGVLSVGTKASNDRITGALEDPSVTTRIEIDQGAAAAFNADMLRGAGLGDWDATLEVRTGKAYVHNVFLEYAAATGIFGLLWAVMLILFLIGSSISVMRRGADPPTLVLGQGLFLAGVFTATQFLFDDNLLNPQYAWLLLWVVGGSLVLAATVDHSADSRET